MVFYEPRTFQIKIAAELGEFFSLRWGNLS